MYFFMETFLFNASALRKDWQGEVGWLEIYSWYIHIDCY